MKRTSILKKSLWSIVALAITALLVQSCYVAWPRLPDPADFSPVFYGDLVSDWVATWSTVVFLLPLWLLSLLELGKAFLGEDRFHIAEKIPLRFTKVSILVILIMLIVWSTVGAAYLNQLNLDLGTKLIVESGFLFMQEVLAVALFYSVQLLGQQYCIRKGCSRRDIWKMRFWITITALLVWFELLLLEGMDMWYAPLHYVDNLNTLEDYYLWQFCLFLVVFFLPFCFFAARKAIRICKGPRWLSLSEMIPRKVSGLLSLSLLGLTLWRILEYRDYTSSDRHCDVAEIVEASAMGRFFQILICGLCLFYAVCIWVKQIITKCRNRNKEKAAKEGDKK